MIKFGYSVSDYDHETASLRLVVLKGYGIKHSNKSSLVHVWMLSNMIANFLYNL